MTWFKVDDNLHSHPKRHQAGLRAMGLWVIAGSWASAHLTDGFVPKHMLASLGGQSKDARSLVESGLWLAEEDGWQFHDWEAQNPTREDVEGKREDWRNRQRLARERKARAAAHDPSPEDVTRDTRVTHESVNEWMSPSPVPSRPVPSLTTPKGVGSVEATPTEEASPSSADAAAPTPSKKGRRIPDGWTPSRTDANKKAEGGIDPDRLRLELDKFHDYWSAKTGQQATKLDWDATWRNWLRNARDIQGPTTRAADPLLDEHGRYRDIPAHPTNPERWEDETA